MEYGEIKTQYKKFLTSSQVMVDFAIDSKDGKKIKKILSVAADPKITAVDPLNGEAAVNGRVNYKVLYLNQDDEIISLDYFSDYRDRVSSKEITPSSVLVVKSAILDINIGDIGDSVNISLVIENSVYIIAQSAMPVLKSLPDGYFDERKSISVQTYSETVRSVIEIADEAAIGAAVGRILMFDTAAHINGSTVENGVITAKGIFYADILYTTGDGAFDNKTFSVPFTDEQQSPRLANPRLIADAVVKSSKVVLAGSADNNIIRIEAFIEITGTVISVGEEEVIADLFSVTKDTEASDGKLEVEEYVKSASFVESVTGSASLDESMPAVNDLLGHAAARNNVATLKAERDGILAEGVVNVSVIYRDADERINSVDVEIPYSAVLRDQDISEGDRIEGRGGIFSLIVKRKRDRELEISCDLFFALQSYRAKNITAVADVAELGERSGPAGAISIYNAGVGETLWDVSKALCCTPEEIVKQNEGIAFPFKEPGRIMLYRSLE